MVRLMPLASRILAVILLLVLGFGTPGYSMPSGEMEMSSSAITSAAGYAMLEEGDACADDMGMSGCTSTCLTVLLVLLDVVPAIEFRQNLLGCTHRQQISGWTSAPDPFPPKAHLSEQVRLDTAVSG